NSIARARVDGTGQELAWMNPMNDAYSLAIDGSHLYWTELHTGGISRSNLDGTRIERTFVAGPGEPIGLAVDALEPPAPPIVPPVTPPAGGGSSSGSGSGTTGPPAPSPVKPSNAFKIAKKLNTKNGTATLTVTVPGPGALALASAGIKKV